MAHISKKRKGLGTRGLNPVKLSGGLRLPMIAGKIGFRMPGGFGTGVGVRTKRHSKKNV